MRTRSQWQASPSDELARGVVLGDYRIEKKLGRGGMGTVYAAVHPLIEKRVAIKMLRRDLCAREEIVARFIQEARAVNRIEHPNIVEVFGIGESDSQLYLVMELLTGTSLAERLKAERLPVTEVCDILTDITFALEAAHECGIVHRDMKPDNVFLASSRGRTTVKLLDFGIAKLHDSALSSDTAPGTILGTPYYMAPEQASGLGVDGQADVYALGIMLFEMLTGRVPFSGGSALALLQQHITEEAPDPSTIVPSLPLIADQLVGEMLRKNPAQRPSLARIRDMLDELRAAMFATGTNPISKCFAPRPTPVQDWKQQALADTDEHLADTTEHFLQLPTTVDLVPQLRKRLPVARALAVLAALGGATLAALHLL